MKRISFFTLFLFFLISPSVHADQGINMIRTLCIHEAGVNIFTSHLEAFSDITSYINIPSNDNAPKSIDDRLKVLKKYGLVLPDKFSYECKLEKHSYKIFGETPPHKDHGMCGGNPRSKISMLIDDQLVLDNVYYSPSCFTFLHGEPHPYLKDIKVDEYRDNAVTYSVSNGLQDNDVLNKPGTISTQKTIDCLTKDLANKKNVTMETCKN